MWGRLYAAAASLVFRLLLRPEPPLELTREKQAAFDAFAAGLLDANGGTVAWDLPYPLHEFTRYLVSHHPVLLHGDPFGGGYVHVVPRQSFRPTSSRPVRFPEWVSAVGVKPLARISVAQADFPFARRIAGHRWGEFFPLTWILYRWRTR